MSQPTTARRTTTPVEHRPVATAGDTRRQMEYLAWLLDESIRIPILGVRIGVDGLLGLIPGVGDLIAAGMSSLIIRQAIQLGVPRIVILRMVFNTAIDFAVGSIPLLGDIFDFGWKANRRNVNLVLKHLDDPRASRRSSWTSVLVMLGAILAVVISLVFGAVALVGALL